MSGEDHSAFFRKSTKVRAADEGGDDADRQPAGRQVKKPDGGVGEDEQKRAGEGGGGDELAVVCGGDCAREVGAEESDKTDGSGEGDRGGGECAGENEQDGAHAGDGCAGGEGFGFVECDGVDGGAEGDADGEGGECDCGGGEEEWECEVVGEVAQEPAGTEGEAAVWEEVLDEHGSGGGDHSYDDAGEDESEEVREASAFVEREDE